MRDKLALRGKLAVRGDMNETGEISIEILWMGIQVKYLWFLKVDPR